MEAKGTYKLLCLLAFAALILEPVTGWVGWWAIAGLLFLVALGVALGDGMEQGAANFQDDQHRTAQQIWEAEHCPGCPFRDPNGVCCEALPEAWEH